MNNNNMRKESVKSSEKKNVSLPTPSSHAVSQSAVKQQINVLEKELSYYFLKCLYIFYLKPF